MPEALITGAVAIVVCLINNIYQRRAANKQHHTTVALIEYKLDQLTRKVELHNNAVERLYKVENTIGVQTEQIKVANHRIEDLEKERSNYHD